VTRTGLLLLIALTACRPALDAEDALLPVPASLPALAIEPPTPAATARALELTRTGDALVVAGKLKESLPQLTEAVVTDPSLGVARLALARAFARGGRASVAMRLLQPAAEQVKTCGMCVELLQMAATHEDFAHLRRTAEGTQLFARVPSEPLAWDEWALRVATGLRDADPVALAPFFHPRLPFAFVRACPTCPNEAMRAPVSRDLAGTVVMAKIAARFDMKSQQFAGTPLAVLGRPKCALGCCAWPVTGPVAAGQAAVKRVCLRPVTPTQAHVTEIAIMYGPGMR
jgi:hypothetical protein